MRHAVLLLLMPLQADCAGKPSVLSSADRVQHQQHEPSVATPISATTSASGPHCTCTRSVQALCCHPVDQLASGGMNNPKTISSSTPGLQGPPVPTHSGAGGGSGRPAGGNFAAAASSSPAEPRGAQQGARRGPQRPCGSAAGPAAAEPPCSAGKRIAAARIPCLVHGAICTAATCRPPCSRCFVPCPTSVLWLCSGSIGSWKRFPTLGRHRG